MGVQVFQLKPNPAGKDRGSNGSFLSSQLGGEWVDIKNIGGSAVNLSSMKLQHKAYWGIHQSQFQWTDVVTFNGNLGAGQVVRIHAGSGPNSALKPADMAGAQHHIFSGRNQYVWNNKLGDAARLISGQAVLDEASYRPSPPEGVVLHRVGTSLVAATFQGYRL